MVISPFPVASEFTSVIKNSKTKKINKYIKGFKLRNIGSWDYYILLQ